MIRAAQSESLLFAPQLVEVLDCKDPEVRKAATGNLTKSLPLVEGKYRRFFDAHQSKILVREAMRSTDPEFALICLAALERIGGKEVLGSLGMMSRGWQSIDGERAHEVQSAARMASVEIRLRTATRQIDEEAMSLFDRQNSEANASHGTDETVKLG